MDGYATQEKIQCPSCGAIGTDEMVVGKTDVNKRGVREIHNVMKCTCGKVYRGKITKSIKFADRPRGPPGRGPPRRR
ncbi:MAG: hypothetical protein QF415_09005 [Candidatus Undinarchaeales archaeon]|jgi:uncharacterized Zn finger protein|nr:hypothetical protein [Candidatus Undinarchaeales archaeon]MDP7493249.1 hypothetical protein [Candidatus Undinarchaeales archaeon]